MKKYSIHYSYYATADVEVLANSQDEALEKASKQHKDFDYSLNEETIRSVEEAEELEELVLIASEIVKNATDDGIEIKLNPWPYITVDLWNGFDFEARTEIMEQVYWDDDRDEIGFETDHYSELTLVDIPEFQQYEICKAIIEKGGKYA